MYSLLASTISGIKRPTAPSIDIVTDTLFHWFDPTTLSGTVWDNRAYNEGLQSVYYTGNLVNGAAESTDSNNIKACYFDGSNDRASLSFGAYNTWLNIDNANTGFTIETWVRSNGSWLSNGNIWSCYGNGGIRCRVESGVFKYPYIAGGSAHSVGSLSTDTWHHIVTTFDPSVNQIKTYFNGVLTKTQSSGWTPASWIGGTCMLGSYQSSGEYQRMYLSTFRVYEKPLSLAEVEQNYNAEKSYHGY